MGWARKHISKLLNGETVVCRPRGNSMAPYIKSGELVTIKPVLSVTELKPGLIVLCRVRGKEYLHFIGATKGNQYRIENAKGFVNGWVTSSKIFGIKN